MLSETDESFTDSFTANQLADHGATPASGNADIPHETVRVPHFTLDRWFKGFDYGDIGAMTEVPVRQWVLSIPFALRYRLAYDSRLMSKVLNVFIRTVFAELRRRAHELLGLKSSQCGAVTFVQTFNDALNLAPHFHSLCIDGVYAADEQSRIADEAPRLGAG